MIIFITIDNIVYAFYLEMYVIIEFQHLILTYTF